jgi:gluconate 2-dehydrogenase gamma chain
MILRRHFLVLGALLGLTTYVKSSTATKFDKAFSKVEETIRAVQEHMFPEGSVLPSARSMDVTKFLYETIKHQSYDKDIRHFVIEGAKELMQRESVKFTKMTTAQKEKALRAYEETHYGSRWLSRIMTLSMEALFSDSVYGSNIDTLGWKSIGVSGSTPRPKTRYLGT